MTCSTSSSTQTPKASVKRSDAGTPPTFITLDVDIVSEKDLTPLADCFEEPAFVLGNQRVDSLFYLSLEPCWFSEEEKTPENCTKFF